MTEIRFYHLQTQPLERALPSILTKALAGGRRTVVRLPDTQEVERMNVLLWTYDPNSFLPHGAGRDGNAAQQPVWLTAKEENPNNADVLILTGGAAAENIEDFTLCCEMLDGNDSQATADARARWKTYRDAGHTVTYWQQSPQGKWEQKG